MQKPEKQEIKDYILERTAEDLQFSQDIVEEVIGWSYKKANQATKLHKEVEISGIGKMMLSQSKLKKAIAKNERIISYLEPGEKRDAVEATLIYLKSLLNV